LFFGIVRNLLLRQKYREKRDSITSLAIYRIRRKVESSTNTCIYSISSIRKARRDCSLCFFRKAKIVLLYSSTRRTRKAETIL